METLNIPQTILKAALKNMIELNYLSKNSDIDDLIDFARTTGEDNTKWVVSKIHQWSL